MASGAPSSLIGSDVTIKGDIEASADLHIDGTVEGDITCTSLVQGKSGRIVGSITADGARLAGLLEGAVSVRELVVLKSATINGDVHYETLTIEQGATVNGRFSPSSATPARAEPAASERSGAPLREVTTNGEESLKFAS